MADLNRVTELYREFPTQFRSLVLGTADSSGVPQASYAPFLMDPDRTLYIYISGLSKHTDNLTQTGRASVLMLADETDTQEIFARRRLTYDCVATPLPRETEQWHALIQRFEARFGNVIGLMKDLPDFQLFQLHPQGGQFVLGFGAAYRISPENLDELDTPPRQR